MTGFRSDRRVFAFCAALLGLLAAGASLWVWSIRPETNSLRADSGDARQVALGGTVYRQHCASCHGARLEGQPDWRTRKPDGRLPAPPHDETGHTWHHGDRQLFEITKFGIAGVAPGYQSDMPAFEGMVVDSEVWAVLAFIKRSWPPRIQSRQERINQQWRRQNQVSRVRPGDVE